jgi:hypothetical protein
MFANRYKINLNTLATGTTATTINIPINMEFQIVDQAELIERVFVDVEVEKAINPILDYEKVRFIPINSIGLNLDQISYNINLSGATDYGSIGFSDDDIKFNKNNFKYTFLNLAFYDTDNPMTQKLVTNLTLFSHLTSNDLVQTIVGGATAGQPKPASQIDLNFVVNNPILLPNGFSEGYHLYDYKDEFKIGDFKYLYMRGSFKNAKTGKSVNLMVDLAPSPIDELVHKLYTRYKLIRNNTGFYYELDDLYHGDGTSGTNNVIYTGNNAVVNLYQIKAL